MTRNAPLHLLGWFIAATGMGFVLIGTLFPSLSGAIFLLSPDYSAADVNAAGMDIILALTAVFGGTMIGWGIAIAVLADHFSKNVRKLLTIGVLGWYVTDTAGSLGNHLEYNAILNTVFLILALAALFVPKIDASSSSA